MVAFAVAGPGLVAIKPFGPVHIVFTVTGISTAGSKSTVQVKFTSDPAVIVPVWLLMIVILGVCTTC